MENELEISRIFKEHSASSAFHRCISPCYTGGRAPPLASVTGQCMCRATAAQFVES